MITTLVLVSFASHPFQIMPSFFILETTKQSEHVMPPDVKEKQRSDKDVNGEPGYATDSVFNTILINNLDINNVDIFYLTSSKD